ncbi:flagellar hook protein FlgE [Alteribacter populi]|uniref:flagellar hook protein FlgE n=1 Tax=Alteribacter populi TaxID=2011011 RepID=UPI000BBAEF4C|nr:flagellar hook protein FlgE [Alteribacter populi]
MIRSMYAGIGGMKNFQTKLDVIGNNISNVNTFGYKKGRATFQDLVSQQLSGASTENDNRGGTNPQQVGLGSTLSSIDTIHTQGSLQTTGRDLDLGISGDGFFIANDGGQSYYTRAGNFYLDEQGSLVTADGLRVQGYSADENGVLNENQVGDLEIAAGDAMAPQATTEASFKGNLDATSESAEVGSLLEDGEAFSSDMIQGNGTIASFNVANSLGEVNEIELVFQKTGENTWQVGYLTDDGDEQMFNQLADDLQFSGNGTFQEADLEDITLPAINGAEPINISLDLSSMTQFSRSSNADADHVNGNLDGVLESYNISESGEINGVFSNGEVRLLGQLALANFNNPGGLSKSGDNLYESSNNSGDPQVGVPGDGGRGSLTGAALEMSNVDLSEEFAEMIVSQRGFQANTKMITTSDEVLQELVNLKR